MKSKTPTVYYSELDAAICELVYRKLAEWELANPNPAPEPTTAHGAGPAPPRERRRRSLRSH